MYNERREGFSFRDVILQIAFVVLFVFLLIWLFPTRSFVEKATGSVNQVKVSETVFADNVQAMKEAGQSYFTDERLPSKVGSKETITLGDMYEEKLLLEFTDQASKSCDLNKSYVEVTKMDKEYVMKIYLQCGSKGDYILVHMGCYTYCESAICEKVIPVKPVVTPKPTPKPTPIPVKIYEYEYRLVKNGYWTDWSAYGEWTTTRQTTSDVKREEEKTVKIFSHYEEKQVQVGTTSEQVFSHYESYQVQTGTTQVQVGTKQVQTGTEQVQTGTTQVQTGTTQVQVGTKQVQTGTKTVQTGTKVVGYKRGAYIGTYSYTTTRADTSTRDYVYVTTKKELSCASTCLTVTKYVYDVYYRTAITEPVYSTVPVYATVPVYETRAVYETKPVYETRPVYSTVAVYETRPVYETRQKTIYKTVTNAVYETVKTAIYKDVKYYRYSTRSYIGGTVSIKWSRSKTDQSLISQGYKLTGAKREVK